MTNIFKKTIPAVLMLLIMLSYGLTAFASEETTDQWPYDSYEEYAEKMVGMELYKTENKVQFYNTFVDQKKLTEETTIDSLFDSNQEGYSTELLLSLNPVQLTEEAPVFKGKDGNYYVVTSVYGSGVFRIPAELYDYCFNGHYYTDGPEGNIVEIVFGLRIQSLYGYDPEITPVSKEIKVTVIEGKEARTVLSSLNMETGTVEVQLLPEDSDENIGDYSVEAVVNKGESTASILKISEDGKKIVFTAGDSHAIGSLDIAISKDGTATTGLLTAPEIVSEKVVLRNATKLASTSTTVVNNITYLDLPANAVPANLAVGDKFIYQHKNVYVASVQNAYDSGNYAGLTGTYNGSSNPTSLHTGSANIPTHDAEWFCYYNDLGNWASISNWFKQTNGYSALNDPTKPDTNTALPGSMVQMTVANMNSRASNNGTTANLGGNRIFGYISEKLGAVTDTTGSKSLNLNDAQLIFACMHAWAYEGSTTPTAVGQALATFAGTSEIAHDQYCGNFYPNLALQCTSVTKDGNYTNATFKCCTSILGVGGMYSSNRNNYQCAFATLYVRYPNPTGEVTIRKVWDDEDNAYYSRPESITLTLWSNADGSFKSTGKTVTMTSADNWASKKITNLPVYRTDDSSLRVKYYAVEADPGIYQVSYSTDGVSWSADNQEASIQTGETFHLKNTMRRIPGTAPYGVTTVSKTVYANGSIVTSDDEFLFRIDILYRPETTDGLQMTVIREYDHLAAVRYYAAGSETPQLTSVTSNSEKDSIVFDNSRKVSLFFVLKGGEDIGFRIFDQGSAVDITELSATDPDSVSVAQYLGRENGFSDRYISSMTSTVSTLVKNEVEVFSWQTPVANGYLANEAVLQNLTASFTVDGDKRTYAFANDRAYDLTVQKVIEGSMASRSDYFTINVTARDYWNEDLNGTFNVVNSWLNGNGETVSENGTITFVNGVATLRLRDGSSVRIKGLPGDTEYAVREQDYTSLGYVTTYQNRTNTLTEDTVVTVMNRRDGVIPTGIHTNAIPIIGMAAASSLAIFSVYVLGRRRRKRQ